MAGGPNLDEYWAFARVRQQLMLTGETDDPILAKYRFTNCYRWCDRVSQYMLTDVVRGRELDEECLWNLILFKTFNRISTWEHLLRQGLVGCRNLKTLGDSLAGRVCFAPAYRMCIGRTTYGYKDKMRNWLCAARSVVACHDDLAAAGTVRELYDTLVQLPMFGRFLSQQIATDIRYVTGVPEDGFIMVGPGSRRGIHTAFDDLRDKHVDLSRNDEMYSERIREVHSRQDFEPFMGQPLSLMDVQNIFCEFDKYTRIRWPEVQLWAKEKKRPKQNYTPSLRGRMKEWVLPINKS